MKLCGEKKASQQKDFVAKTYKAKILLGRWMERRQGGLMFGEMKEK